MSPPRIAVAALNPHAGDGGNFGREEIDVIAPAVKQAQARGVACDGPFPADTVFVRARRGRMLEAEIGDDMVSLGYEGLDGIALFTEPESLRLPKVWTKS